MFSSKLRRPLLALAVTAGLLAVAGPASAEVAKPGHPAGAIVYNGHAGLGTNWAAPELDANANAVFSSGEVMMETVTWCEARRGY